MLKELSVSFLIADEGASRHKCQTICTKTMLQSALSIGDGDCSIHFFIVSLVFISSSLEQSYSIFGLVRTDNV